MNQTKSQKVWVEMYRKPLKQTKQSKQKKKIYMDLYKQYLSKFLGTDELPFPRNPLNYEFHNLDFDEFDFDECEEYELNKEKQNNNKVKNNCELTIIDSDNNPNKTQYRHIDDYEEYDEDEVYEYTYEYTYTYKYDCVEGYSDSEDNDDPKDPKHPKHPLKDNNDKNKTTKNDNENIKDDTYSDYPDDMYEEDVDEIDDDEIDEYDTFKIEDDDEIDDDEIDTRRDEDDTRRDEDDIDPYDYDPKLDDYPEDDPRLYDYPEDDDEIDENDLHKNSLEKVDDKFEIPDADFNKKFLYTPILKEFTISLSGLASEGKLDPVIGRKKKLIELFKF